MTIVFVGLAFTLLQSRQRNPWLEARSAHFLVVSNVSEQRVRRVSQQFDLVRAILRSAFGDTRVDDGNPVTVLAVDDEERMNELLPQFWERNREHPVGGYWKGPYRHYIVLHVGAPDDERLRRMLHEYVHLLTRVHVADRPAWLDEGLSEVWSTALIRSDGAEIGRPAAHHVELLRTQRSWIPLDKLLAMERAPDARDPKNVALFYAESWALTHYLLLGTSSSSPEFAPSDYVKRLRETGDPLEAARLAFGDLKQLEQVLVAYVRKGQFRTLRIRSVQYGGTDDRSDLNVRPLSEAESLATRAAFLVDGERPAAALPLLKEAVRLNSKEPSVLETLGMYYFQQNDPVEAARWFDRVIESGKASYLAYFYRAILPGRASEQKPADLKGPPYVRRPGSGPALGAEDLLRRAVELNPRFAPAYARLADLCVDDGRLDDALPLLQQAVDLEPDNPAYWVNLARVLSWLERREEALRTRERGLAAVRSATSRAAIEMFLRELDDAAGGVARPR